MFKANLGLRAGAIVKLVKNQNKDENVKKILAVALSPPPSASPTPPSALLGRNEGYNGFSNNEKRRYKIYSWLTPCFLTH